ncbi:hypothetical protein DL768_001503 [Monosporascus sp. mg162]|nr:hypothetical protein DL768_001503 [Monosporascus sp. mg162]
MLSRSVSFEGESDGEDDKRLPLLPTTLSYHFWYGSSNLPTSANSLRHFGTGQACGPPHRPHPVAISATTLTTARLWAAPPINQYLLSPLPPFFLSTTGSPAAAPVYAAAAAKKHLAEALVLHKSSVVTKDVLLLVQGMVGKGVGAPVDIAAGAAAPVVAGAAVAPVLIASAPVSVPGAPAVAAPSAADIRKAFLEKVHATAAGSIAEEGKREGKGEISGGLLIDASVPPAAPAAITVPTPARSGITVFASAAEFVENVDPSLSPKIPPLNNNRRHRKFWLGRTATTDSVHDDVQGVLDASAAERLDEALAAAWDFGVAPVDLQKAADDFKVAKRKAENLMRKADIPGKGAGGERASGAQGYTCNPQRSKVKRGNRVGASTLLRNSLDGGAEGCLWGTWRGETIQGPTKSCLCGCPANTPSLVPVPPALTDWQLAPQAAAAGNDEEAPARPATRGRQAAPKKPVTRSMSEVAGAAPLKRKRGVETGARSRPVRAAEAAKTSVAMQNDKGLKHLEMEIAEDPGAPMRWEIRDRLLSPPTLMVN